jgi:hypothetical protein
VLKVSAILLSNQQYMRFLCASLDWESPRGKSPAVKCVGLGIPSLPLNHGVIPSDDVVAKEASDDQLSRWLPYQL